MIILILYLLVGVMLVATVYYYEVFMDVGAEPNWIGMPLSVLLWPILFGMIVHGIITQVKHKR